MRAFLKYTIVCLLCLAMLIPSACAPGGQNEIPSPTPDGEPTISQPVEEPDKEDEGVGEPVPTPGDENPIVTEEPMPEIEPIVGGDNPAVHPDEETELFYDLDGISGKVPAVYHCNINGYSIVYDALHYERRTYHSLDSYWSEVGLYVSVSVVYDMSIDVVMDGLMLQENIEMVPESTTIGSGDYLAYTLYHNTEDGMFRQFWVMDDGGNTLLIERSYPLDHEYVDFHRAVQQAMLDSLTLVAHDAEAVEAFQAVLDGTLPVTEADSGEAVTLEEFRSKRSEQTEVAVEHTALAYCDLDGDESPEMVLLCMFGENVAMFNILRWQDGAVYLYEVPYRGMMDLKNDGTFYYSGGISNSGAAVLRFEDGNAVTEPFTYVTSELGEDPDYFVDGVPAEAPEFHVAMEQQGQKTGVVWYALKTD